MIEVKTTDLIGPALDWAVAKAVGQRLETHNGRAYVPGSCPDSWTTQQYISSLSMWKPSTDWNQGGRLIEEHRVSVGDSIHPDDNWTATLYVPDEEPWQFDGPTPLIAAMRCLVAGKLGEVVMVPKELLP